MFFNCCESVFSLVKDGYEAYSFGVHIFIEKTFFSFVYYGKRKQGQLFFSRIRCIFHMKIFFSFEKHFFQL